MADLSAYDNLWLWYSAWGRAKKEVFAPESPEEQLGLREMARKRVGRLSGGYQKRLAIAAALAGKPDYLLLDEPFAPLDIHCRDAVVGLLRRHALTGGVVFSSHDPVAVAMLADDVLFLRDGTIADTLPLSRSANPEERGRAVLDAFYHML